METSRLISAIDDEISRLTQARTLLRNSSSTSGGRKKKSVATRAVPVKRVLSLEARKRIADAQRRRWAAQKKAAK
jgi:hypothetical protein